MGSIKKAFKKIFKGDDTRSTTTAPELGFVEADTTNTTESESEKQQLTKGKKRGKKSLKVNMTGAGGTGRNIV